MRVIDELWAELSSNIDYLVDTGLEILHSPGEANRNTLHPMQPKAIGNMFTLPSPDPARTISNHVEIPNRLALIRRETWSTYNDLYKRKEGLAVHYWLYLADGKTWREVSEESQDEVASTWLMLLRLGCI